jgi:hypothetical protein
MAALASLQDLEALIGRPVTSEETARSVRLLEMASAIVTGIDPTAATESPTSDIVRFVVADVARAALVNPASVESETTGSYSVVYGKSSNGGLVVTDQHRALLRDRNTPATAPRRGLVSVQMTGLGR